MSVVFAKNKFLNVAYFRSHSIIIFIPHNAGRLCFKISENKMAKKSRGNII